MCNKCVTSVWQVCGKVYKLQAGDASGWDRMQMVDLAQACRYCPHLLVMGRNEEMVVNNKVAKYSDREAVMGAEDF